MQLKVRQLWAEVEYTQTGEVEEMQLAELIRDGQLAKGMLQSCISTTICCFESQLYQDSYPIQPMRTS